MSDALMTLWSPHRLGLLSNPFEFVYEYKIRPKGDSLRAPLVFGHLWGWARQLYDAGYSLEDVLGRIIPLSNALHLNDLPDYKPQWGTNALVRAIVWAHEPPYKRPLGLWRLEEQPPSAPLTNDGPDNVQTQLLSRPSVEVDISFEVCHIDGVPFRLRCIFDQVELDAEGWTYFRERKAVGRALQDWWWEKLENGPQLRTQALVAHKWRIGEADAPIPPSMKAALIVEALASKPKHSTFYPEDIDPSVETRLYHLSALNPAEWQFNVEGMLRTYVALEEAGLLSREAWRDGYTPYWPREYDSDMLRGLTMDVKRRKELYDAAQGS
jgi:hypothetical protein